MSAAHTGTSKKRALFESSIVQPRGGGFAEEAESGADGEEPGDVCGGGGQRGDHVAAVAAAGATHFAFNLQITLWLWFTVLFANFAEAMAEGRGKAQADALRKAKRETTAYS